MKAKTKLLFKDALEELAGALGKPEILPIIPSFENVISALLYTTGEAIGRKTYITLDEDGVPCFGADSERKKTNTNLN